MVNLTQLAVALGADSFPLGLPVLAGEQREAMFAEVRPVAKVGCFTLAEQDGWLMGVAQSRAEEDPEVASHRLYQDLLRAAQGYSLARIWNYVPRINAADRHGLENYRGFCRGRSLAFEQEWGAGFTRNVSSASAVGTDADVLTVVFAAHRGEIAHFENPLQVAAYDYPPEHGPRAPSFARATRVGRDVFISGTASVRGHQSMFPGDTARQLECTLENLREISRVAGLGEDLGLKRSAARYVKIYLRHAGDLALVSQQMKPWLCAEDRLHTVRADICRAELNVEIEVSVFGLHD